MSILEHRRIGQAISQGGSFLISNAKIRNFRSQNNDFRGSQPSNYFLERFAKNLRKPPITRARTRDLRPPPGGRCPKIAASGAQPDARAEQ
jgi:hypothetical protein